MVGEIPNLGMFVKLNDDSQGSLISGTAIRLALILVTEQEMHREKDETSGSRRAGVYSVRRNFVVGPRLPSLFIGSYYVWGP